MKFQQIIRWLSTKSWNFAHPWDVLTVSVSLPPHILSPYGGVFLVLLPIVLLLKINWKIQNSNCQFEFNNRIGFNCLQMKSHQIQMQCTWTTSEYDNYPIKFFSNPYHHRHLGFIRAETVVDCIFRVFLTFLDFTYDVICISLLQT